MNKYKQYFSEDWYEELKDSLESDHFSTQIKLINQERSINEIIPEKGAEYQFRAFRETPLNKVKIVIIGQDPYPTVEPNRIYTYDGLAFSNSNSLYPSPSLVNILKEVKECYPNTLTLDELDLTRWAKQGVFLYNIAQTVIKGKPKSHTKYWELFTLYVIKVLNKQPDLIWLLFGRDAQKVGHIIDNRTHCIINTSHPSPTQQANLKQAPIAFTGSKCFLLANEELKLRNKSEIIW